MHTITMGRRRTHAALTAALAGAVAITAACTGDTSTTPGGTASVTGSAQAGATQPAKTPAGQSATPDAPATTDGAATTGGPSTTGAHAEARSYLTRLEKKWSGGSPTPGPVRAEVRGIVVGEKAAGGEAPVEMRGAPVAGIGHSFEVSLACRGRGQVDLEITVDSDEPIRHPLTCGRADESAPYTLSYGYKHRTQVKRLTIGAIPHADAVAAVAYRVYDGSEGETSSTTD